MAGFEVITYGRFWPITEVYNLKSDKFISNHGDVTGHQVAYAFWNGLTAAS
jgi:hypothetical protein